MHVLFENRLEAGKRIAKRLARYHASDAVILAIPRGGVPVAASAAQRLQLMWSFIVTRKLPVPANPEAGFGAVANDGTIALNKAMLTGLHLTKEQIKEIAEQISSEVSRCTDLYTQFRPQLPISGKPVIIIDDGVASGYTMLAAIKSARKHNPKSIVAAAPVASRSAAALIEECADECEFEIVSPAVPFAVADFYVAWRDLADEDLLPIFAS